MLKQNFIFIFIFILILMVLVLPGCKKESDNKNNDTHYISEDFKPWAIYKPGSYWIYLNEQTGKADCTYVTSDTTFMTSGSHYDEYHNGICEIEGMGLESNLFRYIEVDATGSYPDLVSGNADMTISLKASGIGGISFSYYLLEYPKFTLYRDFEQIINIGVKQVYPSETINGRMFSNVYDLQHEWLTLFGDSLVTEAHLAKSAGIIKFRVFREPFDTTWSLLRYKAVQ